MISQGKGNRHKRTLSDLIDKIYTTEEVNNYLNNILLSKFMKKESFTIEEIKDIYDKLIVYVFKESNKYGTINIHNFGSIITTPNENKTIKIRFNKNVKKKLKLLNERYIQNKDVVILCDTKAKLITYTQKIDLSKYLINDFNTFLKDYMEIDKICSKSGKVWKYIMLEFYTLFFLRTFDYIVDLLFKYYMVDIHNFGTFCFKSNISFGLYIKYNYKEE